MKSKWTIAAAILLAASLGLTGCEGDDGKDGAPGVGTPGTDGQNCWDLNGNGIADPEEDRNGDGVVDVLDCQGAGVVTLPLETCAVCHSDGAFASAPAVHEVFDIGSFADFAVAPDGADLVVSFSVTVDGAPATGATFYRAYTGDGLARTTLTGEVEADPTLFVNNGDGTYSLRIVDGVARFGGEDLRYLVILRTGANALEIAAVGDYPNPIALAGLASNASCIGCHGESGEVGRFAPDNRGGHYSAPISADACVVCHMQGDNEPSYMRLARVAHGIHNSHNFPGGEFVSDRGLTRPDDYPPYNVTYPTYMTNCSVCHSDDNVVPAVGVSALAAANAMPVTAGGCFSCHGAIETIFPPDADPPSIWAPIHAGVTGNCEGCHVAGGVGGAVLTVADAHNGLTTERGGIIWNGVDTSVTEGAKFDWAITGIVDDGVNLAISWQASYDNVPVNPCNETVGPTAPLFILPNNLSMLRNYFQGDDPILGQSTGAPGQANSVNVTFDNTTCTGNVATTTIMVDDVDAERGIVALQGKPRVVSVADPAGVMAVRAKTPTYEWIVGDGDAPDMARRPVVDTGECLQCHVGSLYQHGGNRVDNVDMCVLCHNSASNEQSVRVGLGVEQSEAYDGQVGETFEMKTMLHRVHSSGTSEIAGKATSPLYVIYRNRGIYAWAPDETFLPDTWPGTGEQIVFGSEGDRVINHNFHAPTYPRALNACTACHEADFAVIPDQTQAMATTVDAGSTEWINQLDDTLQGAATTACITCHSGGPAKGHAYQNSWVPQVFPEGRETIIEAVR